MTRLYVLVEGQTEEHFVSGVLAPHLGAAVTVIPIIVATSRDRGGRKRRGGGHWKHWFKDLRRLVGEQSARDVRFTTLFDLYGLPDDFPELDVHRLDPDTNRRAGALESAMAAAIGDWRLIPYIQRHEFEALVLASLDALDELLDAEDRAGVESLRRALRGLAPEEINDGPETAPSKRLESAIPSYEKVTHGPLAIESAGLATIRKACPRFDAWLRALEALAREAEHQGDVADQVP